MADGRRMIRRIEQFHQKTVEDIVNWCHDNGVSMAEATVSFCHLKWESPETDEEHAQYMKHVLASDRRREEWERNALVRFAEQYGYVLVPKGDIPDDARSSDPATWPNVG